MVSMRKLKKAAPPRRCRGTAWSAGQQFILSQNNSDKRKIDDQGDGGINPRLSF